MNGYGGIASGAADGGDGAAQVTFEDVTAENGGIGSGGGGAAGSGAEMRSGSGGHGQIIIEWEGGL